MDLSGETGRPGLDEVLSGQWVQPEARLNYRVVHGGSHGDKSAALIFWEPAHADAPRLLLHGSPEHLVGAGQSAPAETIGLPISHSVGMADF